MSTSIENFVAKTGSNEQFLTVKKPAWTKVYKLIGSSISHSLLTSLW